jgi:polyisoprenoid-binding protein YceI
MVQYRIDADRSNVWIDAKSSLHGIHSETHGLEGTFEAEMLGGRINPAVPPRGHLELSVNRLSSGNPLYDSEMRRRIDARKYPIISGVLTGIRETAQDGRYLVAGDVTFRGVTKPYEDSMTLDWPDEQTIRLEGQHVFDIRDFGMNPPRILTLRVYPEVTVRVLIVATSSAT